MVTNRNMNNVLHYLDYCMNNQLRNIFTEKTLQHHTAIPIVFDLQVHCPFKVKQDLTFTPMSVIKPFFFHEDSGLFSI